MSKFVISNLRTNKYFKMREWNEKGNFNTIIDSFLVENKENATSFTEDAGIKVMAKLAVILPDEHFVLKEI